MIRCALCNEDYHPDGKKQPNALSCGHSFCRQCIEDLLSKGNPIRCPSCYAYTDKDSITPNYVIIQIISGGFQNQPIDSLLANQTTAIKCQVCSDNEATARCYQCHANGFCFCDSCWDEEHNRNFPPVRQHEKKLINENLEIPGVVHCEIHPDKVVTLFSFKYNRFACNVCSGTEAEFPKEDYMTIATAFSKLHRQVARRLDTLQQYLVKSQGAMDNLSTMLGNLDMEATNMTEKFRTLFADFEVNLKRRKVQLESLIDSEVCTVYHSMYSMPAY